MKQLFKFLNVAVLITTTLFISSCKKDVSNETASFTAKSLLTNKTWEAGEVTDFSNGIATVQYKKGANNNMEDYSKVRMTFNADNSLIMINEEGTLEKNATYKLLENDKKIQVNIPDLFPIVYEIIAVTKDQLSFKLVSSPTEFTQYILTPVQ